MSVTRSFHHALMAVAVAFGGTVTGYANAEEFRMTVMHTNDVHSHHEAQGRSGNGGAARQATVVSDIRAEVENSVLLDAGDQFTGTLFHQYYPVTTTSR